MAPVILRLQETFWVYLRHMGRQDHHALADITVTRKHYGISKAITQLQDDLPANFEQAEIPWWPINPDHHQELGEKLTPLPVVKEVCPSVMFVRHILSASMFILMDLSRTLLLSGSMFPKYTISDNLLRQRNSLLVVKPWDISSLSHLIIGLSLLSRDTRLCLSSSRMDIANSQLICNTRGAFQEATRQVKYALWSHYCPTVDVQSLRNTW